MNKSQEATEHENFVAHLGHDLRSPLTAIAGFTRLVQRRAQLTAAEQENLDKVLVGVELMLQLIDNIVDLAKLESGLLRMHAVAFNLPAVLHQVTDQMATAATAKNIDLQRQWPNLPDTVQGDELRLAQILRLLLDNAIKFSDSGTVILEVKNLDPYLRFSVLDNGPGISAERLQSLLGESQIIAAAAGTGLGLALSKALLKQLDGTLQAVSTPGKGSCFWFDLQLPVIALDNAAKTTAERNSSQAEKPSDSVPAAALAALQQLSLEGDILGLMEQAEALAQQPQCHAFAQQLITLAKGFQVNKICQLLDLD